MRREGDEGRDGGRGRRRQERIREDRMIGEEDKIGFLFLLLTIKYRISKTPRPTP